MTAIPTGPASGGVVAAVAAVGAMARDAAPARPDPWMAELADNLIDAGSREHYADAALYDYEYRRRRADVTFYREIARRRGADQILELGAGSGRVTVPLARDGHHVVALDQSEAMLGRLRDRVAHLPPAAARRITPVIGDLRTFTVSGRFPLVIAAFNVIEHLYTRGEITACLQRIAAHLAPGGAFVFDVQVPDLAWLLRDPNKRWAKTRFTDPTTGRAMYYSTNHDYDPISQIALIRLYYEPADKPAGSSTVSRQVKQATRARTTQGVDPNRAPMAEGGSAGSAGDLTRGSHRSRRNDTGARVVKLSQRKFFPAELEALVAHAGFRVSERYGDFLFRPLDGTADSQVLVCEPAPKRPRK
jgi:SAM-dependent methyltransferase